MQGVLTQASRRRRRVKVAAVVVIVLLVGAVVVKKTLLNDTVHQLSTDEALRRFREQAGSTTSAAGGGDHAGSTSSTSIPAVLQALPTPGVYLYSTAGLESIDAVGGSTHRYPEQTTITVVHDGCGVSLRWDALKERREQWMLCLEDDGIALAPEGQAFHEFFGQTRTEDLTCDRSVVVLPADGAARPPVALSCLLGENTWLPSWEVLERSRLTVGATVVPVQHVRMTISDNDHYYEHYTMDWYLDERGLPIQVRVQKESLSDTAYGDVLYTEVYGLDLLSLSPLR